MYLTQTHSPSALHDVLVDEAVSDDVLVEELVGQQHQ